MKKRPIEAECGNCGEKIVDEHGELPATIGGGERWVHKDAAAWAARREAGDMHVAVVGKVTETTDIWEQKDYEAAAKKKGQD